MIANHIRTSESTPSFNMGLQRKTMRGERTVVLLLLLSLMLPCYTEASSTFTALCKPCRCYIGKSLINNYSKTTIADCSYMFFPEIPTHLPTSITQLNLTSSGLIRVSASALRKYPDLEVLILDKNRFDKLEKDSFPDPNSIEMLSMRGTVLKFITADAFSNVPNVRTLFGLETDKYPPGIFKPLPRLQELSLKSSYGLPIELLDDTSLKTLNLYLNSSESIPLHIFSNSSKTLQELRIIADHLESLPSDLLRNMPTLRQFSIVVGDMEELPEKFFGEQEQSYCYISEVSIMGVRKIGENLFCDDPNLYKLTIHASEKIESGAFHTLVRLHTLNLSHNRLSKINPKWFLYITGLKELILSFNMFTILDSSSLSGLRMLEKLDISHNFLIKIHPDTFRYVHNTLMIFDASYNQLTEVEDEVLNEMVSLDVMDLSNNKLNKLPGNTFKNLYSLTEVELSNNQLTSLPDETFDSLRGLERLNLSSNTLGNLPDGVFLSTPALKVLDLSNNRLKRMPKFFLAEDAALEYVDLVQQNDTDFICDCTLVHLQLGTSNEPDTFAGHCQFPIHVRGRHITTITLTEVCSEDELKKYIEQQTIEIDRRNKVRTTNNDVKTEEDDKFNSLFDGDMRNSRSKIFLILFISCLAPLAVVGLLLFIRRMRGIMYTRVYKVNEDTGRL